MDSLLTGNNPLSGRGGYVLILRLDKADGISVGSLGTLDFRPGYYAYAGSAMRGLHQRVARHLRREKKTHWHIDYLAEKATVESVIVCRSTRRIECDIAGEIGKVYTVIAGFGSSDCKCPGHLYYGSSGMSENIMNVLMSAGMKPERIITERV